MLLISCAGNGRCFVYVLFAACFGQTWTHAASSCAICIISTEIIVVGFQQLQDTYAHLMYPRSRHKTTTTAREVWAVMLDEQSAPSNQTVTVTSNGNSTNFGVFAARRLRMTVSNCQLCSTVGGNKYTFSTQ